MPVIMAREMPSWLPIIMAREEPPLLPNIMAAGGASKPAYYNG
jgi:hypothetical protein